MNINIDADIILYEDLNCGSGGTILTQEFVVRHWVYKADMLNDWINQLQLIRDTILNEIPDDEVAIINEENSDE